MAWKVDCRRLAHALLPESAGSTRCTRQNSLRRETAVIRFCSRIGAPPNSSKVSRIGYAEPYRLAPDWKFKCKPFRVRWGICDKDLAVLVGRARPSQVRLLSGV